MPISNIWTIQKGTDPAVSFDSLNLSAAKLNIVTQSTYSFTCSQHADYDADPAFAYGETVTIYRDGVQWFKGRCLAPKRTGAPASERIDYQIACPWIQLQNVIYEQSYTRSVVVKGPGGDTLSAQAINLARIILGSDENGQRIHSGAVITACANFAIAALGASALFQLGTVEVSTEVPFEEVKTLSCAEIINRVLRWNPDVVAYFDYSTATPTLNFKHRASLASKTFAINDVVIVDNSINPRNDLQKDGVQIKYERVNQLDGEEYSEVLTDEAGELTDLFKVLKVYLDLDGSKITLTKQELKVESIAVTSAAWWKKQLPQLANATNISVSGGTRTPVDDSADGGVNNGESLTKVLVTGSIAAWMSVKACKQIISGTVTYTADGETKTEKLTFSVLGTDARSKVYSRVGSAAAAEAPPVGLAAAILASLNTLHYEGSITLKELDVGVETHINKTINISGGRTEWASMEAQVYSVAYDLESGTTQISFGPARHLGADDLFQLTRNIRTRQAASGAGRLQTDKPSADLPTRAPATVTAGGGGGGATPPLNAYKTGDGILKVQPGSVKGVEATGTDLDVSVVDGDRAWVKATLDVAGTVTAVAITAVDPGADTATQTSRLIYIISGSGAAMVINNLLGGSQNIDSCGADHSWNLV